MPGEIRRLVAGVLKSFGSTWITTGPQTKHWLSLMLQSGYGDTIDSALLKHRKRCRIRIMETFIDIIAGFAGLATVWGGYYACLKFVDGCGRRHG